VTDQEPTENAKAEPDPPLNRAARRALRRGKNLTSRSLAGPGVATPAPRNQVAAVRRRAGRRGNR